MENVKEAKILMIEDDVMHQKMYAAQFSLQGFSAFSVVGNGEEGLEAMRREKPDIILLDLHLEGMDGLDVLKAVKEDADLQDIPVIVLSNAWEKTRGKEAKDLGAVDYLLKTKVLPKGVVQKVEHFLTGTVAN